MLRETGTYCRENTQNNNISGGQLMPPRGLEYYRWRYIIFPPSLRPVCARSGGLSILDGDPNRCLPLVPLSGRGSWGFEFRAGWG